MIAIFTRDDQQFRDFSIYPKTSFKRIRQIDDIHGYKFTSILLYYDWFKAGQHICDAYDALKARQPELFD